MLVQAAVHAGGTLGLNAVDLDVRLEALDGKGHAGDQAAAAHRHNDRIHIRQLIQNFQTNGSLPRDDLLIVIGVDKGHAGLFLQLHSLVVGIIVGAGHQTHLCAQILGILHLHDGGTIRHTDDALDAATGSSQRHALCVVAGRAGDHALGALLLGKLADLIVSTAHLKAAGGLQVFGFQVQLAVLGELGCLDEVGLAGNILEHKGCMVDLIQSQHGFLPLFLSFPTLRLFRPQSLYFWLIMHVSQYRLTKLICQMNFLHA